MEVSPAAAEASIGSGGVADAQTSRAIQRLPEEVINRIAAGEIIQRPANALKELVENSLDAGATMIRVQLREGGIKMLQIQDDGCGVAVDDLPLLCERFATSKLRAFEDLSSMTTFGFRGEALASISYVSAAMNVVSRTRESELAYKASYASGALVSPKPGQPSAPKPCAGSFGTMITAEDLFYNVPQRRRAMKSASDEYGQALDVVSKYAVHYGGRGVGFSCKKASANVVDLSMPSSSTTTTLDAIGAVYGSKLAKSLERIDVSRDETLSYSFEGYISGASYSAKRAHCLLFINDRLVECPALRRAVLALYATLLPKGSHPFIYLSLSIDPANVDVNVHPTKREVHFLHEDEIIESVCSQAEAVLSNTNASRSFATSQAILPSSMRMPPASLSATANGQKRPREDDVGDTSRSIATTSSSSTRTKPASQRSGYPQHLVRIDGRTRTLDAMGITSSSRLSSAASRADLNTRETKEKRPNEIPVKQEDNDEVESDREELDDGRDTAPLPPSTTQSIAPSRIAESATDLLSISSLRRGVQRQTDDETKAIMHDHAFVGIADAAKTLSLLQHGTKLYLVQYSQVLEELAYQLLLRQFGDLAVHEIQSTPHVDELVRTALAAEGSASRTKRAELGLSDDDVVEKVVSKVAKHAEMLNEYFSLDMRPDGDGNMRLHAVPDITAGRASASRPPFAASTMESSESMSSADSQAVSGSRRSLIPPERLPALILRLATQVDYSAEQPCLDGILEELAYAHVPWPCDAADATACLLAAKQHEHDWRSLWASYMRYYSPSRQLARRGAVRAIASLPSLYSVFERC